MRPITSPHDPGHAAEAKGRRLRQVRGVLRANALRLLAVLLLSGTPSSAMGAAAGGGPAGGPGEPRGAPAAEEAAPRTPRALVSRFLELTRAGRDEEAAALLEVPQERRAEGPTLARHLKAVLDRHLWIDLDAVSDAEEGRLDDGLPPDREELGRLAGPEGRPEPIRLARRDVAGEPAWAFARATVEGVPRWYADLPGRWALDHLPAPLLRPGPLDLVWWQWLALLPLAGLAWALGAFLGRATRALVLRLARRTQASWDDVVAARLGGPLTLAWSLGAAGLMLAALGLAQPAQALVDRLLRAGLLVVVFWSMLRGVDVAMASLSQAAWARERQGSRSLLSLTGRIAKVVVAALAVIAALSELGYPVASLLAGLGLGGLAFALAAQKTVENLFGALSIGLDQPFREGDFVRVEEMVGTVEAIGLRATRIRTLDRTLVSIPNGRLADMRLESFSARDRIRLACDLGLVYETTDHQMRTVLEGLEATLRGHPKIWPDAVVVRFKQFGASSLDVEIMAWFQTSDWGEFQAIRQEVLLQFMGVVQAAGTSMAFPTQTVHLHGAPGAPPPGGGRPPA